MWGVLGYIGLLLVKRAEKNMAHEQDTTIHRIICSRVSIRALSGLLRLIEFIWFVGSMGVRGLAWFLIGNENSK